jgi:hypothetical protein
MRLNFDLIAYEAQLFGQMLDQTVIHIHSDAFNALATGFEKQNEGVAEWSEEDSGISKGRYEDFIRNDWMVQIRALTTMTFALLATQLLGFIKTTNRAFLQRHYQPCKTGKKGKNSEFLQMAAEYRECYGIEFNDLPGVETCREVVLARNACIHSDCAPSEDYMRQTARQFLGTDGRLILDKGTLAIATNDMKSFARALARVTRERVDAAKALILRN